VWVLGAGSSQLITREAAFGSCFGTGQRRSRGMVETGIVGIGMVLEAGIGGNAETGVCLAATLGTLSSGREAGIEEFTGCLEPERRRPPEGGWSTSRGRPSWCRRPIG